MAHQRHTLFKVMNQEFWVDNKFRITKELGQGAYGIVCAAKAIDTGESVAVKKVTNIFSKRILTKRALREVKLLQHFRGHKNIICLYDMDIVDRHNFDSVYLYIELLEADLHAIIRSGQPLTDAHYQSFIYQVLCGLKYIHSANVLHRDLKPGNLLVNADCELKICDFGLARGYSDNSEQNAGYMTEYVATRWYRAPEIMLSFQSYTKAIDLWSVGCILAELLGGRPFFKGRDYVDQLNQILHYLGTPTEETLSRIGSQRVSNQPLTQTKVKAQDYVRNLPFMPKIPFNHIFPKANPQGPPHPHLLLCCFLFALGQSFMFGLRGADPVALDLLERLLAFDPAERITVEEALEHQYLAIWHDPNDEPEAPAPFEFDFEHVNDIAQMKRCPLIPTPKLTIEMIYDEVVRFRHLVRNQQPPASVEVAPVQGGLQRSNSISQNTGGLPGAKGAQEAAQSYEKPPGPQEAGAYEDGDVEMGDVERELAVGMDGR